MIPDEHRPSLLRRLAAILYDSMLLIALWIGAGAIWVGFRGGEAAEPGSIAFQIYLLAVAWGFFVGFWCISGRTLGMQAWRLRLIDANGQRVSARAASYRFAMALVSWLPVGLGFLWALLDREGQTWHDRLSRTYLYLDERHS